MSASATYLTAETIARFLPLELQEDYLEVYEKARKKAIAYICFLLVKVIKDLLKTKTTVTYSPTSINGGSTSHINY